MTNILLKTGQSLTQWKKAVTVILEKKPGEIWADKLRITVLLEADFNMICRTIASKRMMDNAHHFDQVLQEQFAKRGSSAIKGALVKYILCNITKVTRTRLVYMSVDADNCYDRITLEAASLCMQRLGVDLMAAETILHTLQDMEYHLRTAFGDSDTSYCAQPGDNFNGTGQGSGASPAIWTAVCIVLLKLLQRKGAASAFTSAICVMPTIVAALCYVDNTDLLQRAQSNTETITHTIQSLQSNVDIWAQGLMAAGGALKPQKCWWSLIDSKHTPQD